MARGPNTGITGITKHVHAVLSRWNIVEVTFQCDLIPKKIGPCASRSLISEKDGIEQDHRRTLSSHIAAGPSESFGIGRDEQVQMSWRPPTRDFKQSTVCPKRAK